LKRDIGIGRDRRRLGPHGRHRHRQDRQQGERQLHHDLSRGKASRAPSGIGLMWSGDHEVVQLGRNP
jgi:hypothetical protein